MDEQDSEDELVDEFARRYKAQKTVDVAMRSPSSAGAADVLLGIARDQAAIGASICM